MGVSGMWRWAPGVPGGSENPWRRGANTMRCAGVRALRVHFVLYTHDARVYGAPYTSRGVGTGRRFVERRVLPSLASSQYIC